jgi:hypothetical protein
LHHYALAATLQAPERFVDPDPEMAQTLLDQKEAGKMLLLITNSDYEYTARMMAFAYDRFLPDGMTWRDLFDMVRWVSGCACMCSWGERAAATGSCQTA